jgi:thiol-disulfide isomerase/thioredoxin
MKWVSLLAILLAILVAAVLLVTRDSTAEAPPAPIYAAAVYQSGQAVSLASLRGKPALLSTWATWCAECQHELPSLEALWQSRGGDGLQIVAVNIDVDGSNPAIGAMIDDLGLTMPIWHDGDNDFSLNFSAPGVPTSILFDAEGRVLKTWIGRTDFQTSEVSAAIDAALSS